MYVTEYLTRGVTNPESFIAIKKPDSYPED